MPRFTVQLINSSLYNYQAYYFQVLLSVKLMFFQEQSMKRQLEEEEERTSKRMKKNQSEMDLDGIPFSLLTV